MYHVKWNTQEIFRFSQSGKCEVITINNSMHLLTFDVWSAICIAANTRIWIVLLKIDFVHSGQNYSSHHTSLTNKVKNKVDNATSIPSNTTWCFASFYYTVIKRTVNNNISTDTCEKITRHMRSLIHTQSSSEHFRSPLAHSACACFWAKVVCIYTYIYIWKHVLGVKAYEVGPEISFR